MQISTQALQDNATSLQMSTIARKFTLNSKLADLVTGNKSMYQQLEELPLKKIHAKVLIPLVHTHSKDAMIQMAQLIIDYGITLSQEKLEKLK